MKCQISAVLHNMLWIISVHRSGQAVTIPLWSTFSPPLTVRDDGIPSSDLTPSWKSQRCRPVAEIAEEVGNKVMNKRWIRI
jgi:hypothetical protein